MIDLDNYLVFNFATGERTKLLSNYCFERLGFKNIVTIENDDSFHKKYLDFANLAVESKFDLFVRSDADRLVFDGLIEMLEFYEINQSLDNITGTFFDCFMNKFRGGTPSFFKRNTLEELVNNPECIQDNQKPETQFGRYLEQESKNFKCENVKIFTNLHEYEQYPSKVCNVFINRLSRGHQNLYNFNYLRELPDHYKTAIDEAIRYHSKNGSKQTMTFLDFSYLDDMFEQIDCNEVENYYIKYKNLYHNLVKRY